MHAEYLKEQEEKKAQKQREEEKKIEDGYYDKPPSFDAEYEGKMNKRIGRYEEFLQLLWNEPGFEEMFNEWKGLPDNVGKDLPYQHTE